MSYIFTLRLHEDLLTSGLSSFLLDIDHRYVSRSAGLVLAVVLILQHQFYDCDKFHRFNMFNGYFYSGEDGRQALKDFVKSIQKEQVLLVIDPPFGGLITALKTGINTIWQTIGQGMQLIAPHNIFYNLLSTVCHVIINT